MTVVRGSWFEEKVRGSLAARLALALTLLSACGERDGGGGDIGGGEISDIVEVEEVFVPPPAWKEMTGVELDGVKRLAGFACTPTQVYFDVEAPERGLYRWDIGSGDMPENIFDGVGPVELAGKQVLVAPYQGTGGASTLVLVDPQTGVGVDQGYSFTDFEIKAVKNVSGKLFTLSKDWTTAQYMVHRGEIGGGSFTQEGPAFPATAMSLYVTPDAIMVLTLLQELAGTVCLSSAVESSGPVTWSDCPAFPDYVAEKDGQPYSANAMMYGNGSRYAAWFRVTDKGVKGARHHVASDKIKWTEVEGFPDVEPTAWLHDGEEIVLGYMGDGGSFPVWSAPYDGSTVAAPLGEDPPAPGDKTGVAGICRSGDRILLAWLDYGPMGSTLSFHRLMHIR